MNLAVKKAEIKKVDKIILYIGDDSSYWQVIQNRFSSQYELSKFSFESLYKKGKPEDHQKAFLKILELKPVFIYIDLSQDLDYHLRLALYLARDNSSKSIPLIGLVDTKSLLRDCLAAKLTAIHVKCGEYHDVVYDPMRVFYPREAKKPEFARTKAALDIQLIDDCRIGYISPTSIHVEGFFSAEEGQEIEIFNEINKTVLPSNKFFVTKKSTSNLYYEYLYAYDMDVKFIEDQKLEEQDKTGDTNLDKLKAQDLSSKHSKASHESELLRIKKKFKQWVISNVDTTAQKKTKILVVDSSLSILKKSPKPLDKYPYAIRFQSSLTEELSELDIIRPNLLAFHLSEFKDDDPTMSEEEKQRRKDLENSSLNILSKILTVVKTMDKYNPFIVIFNCSKYSSKSFQDSYKYSLILTNREAITLETVLEMADLYEEKQERKTNQLIQNKIAVLKKENISKYGRLSLDDFKEIRYHIKKDNPISHAFVRHDAKIIALSESEVMIETSAPLALKSFRVNTPVEMSILLVPDKDNGKPFVEQRGVRTYQGLIHGIGENEKKKLRQTVNEIFFSPINEKRQKEMDQFEDKNKVAWEKKLASMTPEEADAYRKAEAMSIEKTPSRDSENKPSQGPDQEKKS